jgi:ribonuclease J
VRRYGGITLRICIHRGTQEIGGTCIELEAQGQRIVLDLGIPLDSQPSKDLLPHVDGFRDASASLLAVVVSHSHPDHVGLARYLLAGTQMIMGAATERILAASVPFTSSGMTFSNVRHLESGRPLSIGPFTITPLLTDHSAYDAYSLLIEADEQRVFYSGDLRAHGRKSALFERLLKKPPTGVNVLLMEGTTIGRTRGDTSLDSEVSVEECILEQIRRSKGLALVWTSGQNIDRMVSIFKACRSAGRQLVIDMYAAEMLRATGNPKLPQAEWNGVRVFLPSSQKRQIIKSRRFEVAERYRSARIYPRQLSAEARHSVLLFRPSMMRDLGAADCLQDARLIYSLWPGYLKRPKSRDLLEQLEQRAIPVTVCHASGHAPPEELQRFARAIAAKTLVPIHSTAGSRFTEYFVGVRMKKDGEWWEVADG